MPFIQILMSVVSFHDIKAKRIRPGALHAHNDTWLIWDQEGQQGRTAERVLVGDVVDEDHAMTATVVRRGDGTYDAERGERARTTKGREMSTRRRCEEMEEKRRDVALRTIRRRGKGIGGRRRKGKR
jgi:hypothetical protein